MSQLGSLVFVHAHLALAPSRVPAYVVQRYHQTFGDSVDRVAAVMDAYAQPASSALRPALTTLRTVLQAHVRAQEHSDGFFSRLARGQAHDDDVECAELLSALGGLTSALPPQHTAECTRSRILRDGVLHLVDEVNTHLLLERSLVQRAPLRLLRQG